MRSLLPVLLLAACAPMQATHEAAPATPAAAAMAPVPELKPGVPAGYLGKSLPDSLALLPPPPAAGTAGFANDVAVSRASQTLVDTPRYALAASDADLTPAHAVHAFECALGVPITQAQAPRTLLLLKRTMVDAGLGTYGAKNHYNRTRPFVHFKERTCLPADEAALRKDGSYPSGHTAIGWAWALVLTEVAPDHTDALLRRGRAFGESRLVCNAHWQSDILQGRAVASGVVARLHADPVFRDDVVAARGEIAALRQQGATPTTDCAGEAAAIDIRIPGVQ